MPKPIFRITICLIFMGFYQIHFAQGIRGYVIGAEGDTLSFASVFLPKQGTGVSANIHGYYEMRLDSGYYSAVAQYIGFRSRKIDVHFDGKEWKQVDFILTSNATQLEVIEVRPGKEDPAYPIMRKAIAKRNYHRMMYDSYSCKVYTKGTGMILEAPFLIRKQLERDDIYLNRAFTTESVNEVHFRQPDSIYEKVLAIRAKTENSSVSPNMFVNASFYEPVVVGAVSPLADNAMYYYNFGYRGSFEENGKTVYKISVVPKTRGMDTYSGFIYIIDDLYAIHSLELKTYIQGIEVDLSQMYQPVKGDCWMPVNHRILLNGKVMGVRFNYDYVANVDEFKVVLNPNIAKMKIDFDAVPDAPKDSVFTDKKALRKELKKMEKEQQKERENSEVVGFRTFEVDTLAKKVDENFWEKNRPIPLTENEIRGYEIADSLEEVQSDGSDSLKSFDYMQILLGGKYKLSKKSRLRWHTPLWQSGFNSVEGLFVGAKVSHVYRLDTLKPWQLYSDAQYRYGFSSTTHYGQGRIGLKKPSRNKAFAVEISGGKFVRQFNRDEPISQLVNTLHTLLLRENFIKLYEDRFLRLSSEKSFMRKWEISGGVEFSQRHPLSNRTEHSFFFTNTRDFTPNWPTTDPEMWVHRAYTTDVSVLYRPGLKYRMYNGRKSPLLDGTPQLKLDYRGGIYQSGDAFHHLNLGFQHELNFGVSGTLEWNVMAGTFFGTNPEFPDARHFLGNRTFFAPHRDMDHFRLLPYYDFSTRSEYSQLMTRYTFRKLLVTQFFYPRMMGAREQVFVNGLITGDRREYLEVGYSLQNLYRVFRLDIGMVVHPETGRFGAMIGLGGLIRFN
ncbi:MAG: carboxypeptidase-like regulatory domain-containing protein [Cryomorphaceae bacterium]|nr:carboxypeptidase-like regulatory domain-containing protein [Cryomorphaceae bacterium]